MGDWLSSMMDIAGPALSAGGTILGGPAGGALGGIAGEALGGGAEPASSAASTGTLSSGPWSTSFGGSNNIWIILAIAAAIFFLVIKKGKVKI